MAAVFLNCTLTILGSSVQVIWLDKTVSALDKAGSSAQRNSHLKRNNHLIEGQRG